MYINILKLMGLGQELSIGRYEALSDTMGELRLITYKTATGNLLDWCKTIRD